MVAPDWARPIIGAKDSVVAPAARVTKRRRVRVARRVLRLRSLLANWVTLVAPNVVRCLAIRARQPDWLGTIISQTSRSTNSRCRPQAARCRLVYHLGLDDDTIALARCLQRDLTVEDIGQDGRSWTLERVPVAAAAAGQHAQNIARRQCQSRLRWYLLYATVLALHTCLPA